MDYACCDPGRNGTRSGVVWCDLMHAVAAWLGWLVTFALICERSNGRWRWRADDDVADETQHCTVRTALTDVVYYLIHSVAARDLHSCDTRLTLHTHSHPQALLRTNFGSHPTQPKCKRNWYLRTLADTLPLTVSQVTSSLPRPLSTWPPRTRAYLPCLWPREGGVIPG